MDCTVQISVDDRDGRTRATARLRFGGREYAGVGLSRLGPVEHGFAGIGGELAVARALSDLAQRLTTTDSSDPAHHAARGTSAIDPDAGAPALT